MQFLIKNGNVILENTIKKLDILTKHDQIIQIGENLNLNQNGIITIDCSNCFIFPGLVDMHVHLRDPGFLEKETIQTGCNAAAAGGFSTICCMPNTKPVIDCSSVFNYVKQKAQNECANVYIICAITKNLEGKELIDFDCMTRHGAVAFSDDGKCLENEELMEQALLQANLNKKLIVSHCENSKMSLGGLVNQGKISKILNLKGINNLSESSIVEKHINLAAKLNCRIHIAHVSTKESVLIIKKAKKNKIKVTAETCPHYFCLNDENLLNLNANFKINPPIRSEFDRKAVEQALIDKIIDCVVTDHAPHTYLEKKDFLTAPNGAVGLETSLACTLTHFFHTKKLNLNEIVKLMSTNPSKILNLPPNEIKKGAKANFSVVDVNKKWIVDSKKFKSKSQNSPFDGRMLIGKVLKTFFKGRLVFSC